MKKYLSGLFVMLSVLLLLVSTAFASADYTITDIRLTDLKGNSIEYAGGSCMVNVSVTKNTDVANGYVVISSYTEDETLIGFNYLFTSLNAGENATLGALVSPPSGTSIGKVKAMVWDSLDGMTPLAASKTLVPGEEIEEEPTPTPTPDPDPTPSPEPSPTPAPNNIIINNNRVINCDSTSITAYDDNGRIKTYRFDILNIYVNGYSYSGITLPTIVSASDSDIILSDTDGDNTYDRIDVDVYITAMVSAKTTSAITLSGITGAIGSTINPTFDITDVSRINVMRNGVSATLNDISENDVISLKYDMSYALNDAPSVEVYASNKTVTGVYNGYDNENNLYTISGIVYPSVKTMPITLGTEYTFALDYFGKLYSAEENMFAVNFAIVEKFVNATNAANYGSEYAYIDVVTMNGESKRLFIDPPYATIADVIFTSAGIGSSQSANAYSVPLSNRIIEYKVKASTGRVNSVVISTNVDAFSCMRYNPVTNRLSKPLVENAVVLDATKYDTSMPSASDYKASSLSNLKEGVDYDGVLIGKNSSNKWSYVIITIGGATYSISDDFAVAAENASAVNCAIIDDEEVYQLSVIENGNSSATKINISLNAEIYVNGVTIPNFSYGYDMTDYSYRNTCATYLKKGAAFYYTTDDYGLVDRIDVVLQGGYDYDTIKALITEEYGYPVTVATINSLVKIPTEYEIKPNTWFIDVDERDNAALDEQIQLFIAPVLYTGSDFVSFGAVEGNATDGLYVNTNADFSFSIASDANIYSYDMSGNYYGKYAFMSGTFRGFDIADADANGRAWLTNVPSYELNFDRLVQFAFVMAVDGEITNALLFNA